MLSAAPAELRILLHCANPRLEAHESTLLRQVAERVVNWDVVCAAAAEHGLAPLVFRNLTAFAPDCLPRRATDQLKAQRSRAAIRGLQLSGELVRILADLEAEGIAALPFKGPVLAAEYYGDVALRPCRDLDVLIDEADVAAARARLAGRGYLGAYPGSRRQEIAFARHARVLGLYQCEQDISLEIHWRFTARDIALDWQLSDVMPRAQPFVLGGKAVPTLTPADQVLLLCLHGSKHQWSRLIWLVDVALILSSVPVDLEEVLQRADRLRVRRVVALGLILAHHLLDVPVPESVTQYSKDSSLRWATGEVIRRYCDDPAGVTSRASASQRLHFDVRIADRTDQRLACLARVAFRSTPDDWNALRLPDFVFPVYSALRPLRLLIARVR